MIIGFLTLNCLGANLVKAQSNVSSVTNSAAPSASSVTTGGTNINYQSNNTYNNEMGFGPGILPNPNSLRWRSMGRGLS